MTIKYRINIKQPYALTSSTHKVDEARENNIMEITKKERKKIVNKNYREKNKEKIKEKSKNYYQKNKEKIKLKSRNKYIKKIITDEDRLETKNKNYFKDNCRKYKIKNFSWNDYKETLEKQNYVCKICLLKNKSKRRLSVDHCHITGKVRGLLCDNCNLALGNFKDDKKLLAKAIQYLF